MGTTIAMFIFAGLFVCAAFVCSRLHDKLLKERTTVKALRTELVQAHGEMQWLEGEIKELKLALQKAKHKKEALQIDYDRLLTDYHILESENLK